MGELGLYAVVALVAFAIGVWVGAWLEFTDINRAGQRMPRVWRWRYRRARIIS